MAIVINGSGTVTGLSVGGLPDGTVDADTLASGAGGVDGVASSADATAMTITSDEKIGIGETTPLGTVHIKTGDSGLGSVNSNFSQLVVEGNTTAGISILTSTTHEGVLAFSDSGGHRGLVRYAHATDSLSFATADVDRLQITSDGRGLSEFTARAWVKFHGSGTVSIDNSHNVSSVTDVSAGTYQVNVSNNFSNTNWTAVANAGGNSAGESYTFHAQVHGASAASWGIRTSAFNNSNPWISDPESIFSVAFGD